MPAERSEREWLELINEQTGTLASTLRDASDAGVSHALIVPQMMLVFRAVFGEMPAGVSIPGMPQ